MIEMELRFSVLLVILVIKTTNSQLGELQREITRQEPRTYCGGYLAQALSTICKGNYNTLHKKNNYSRRVSWDTTGYMSDMPSGDSTYPFQSKSEATNFMGGTHRRRKRYPHGVFNECCEKSCSKEELSTYCAAPSKRRR
nr:LIRP-like isoform X1 [Leptinotarsa decemlineata]